MRALTKYLSLAVSATVIILLARLCFNNPKVNDFRSFYSGASALFSGNLAGLYRHQLVAAAAGHPLDMPYTRPPAYYAVIPAPFALLPFAPAFCLWVGLQTMFFLFLLFWAQSRRPAAVVACLFPPVLISIGSGQDTIVFLGVLAASYALFRRQKDLPAGLVLGLGLLKFHLFLLWPVVFAVQKRWRALAGFSLTAAVIAISCAGLVGIHGVRDYLAILLDPTRSSPRMAEEVGIGGLMANMRLSSLPAQLALGGAFAAIAIYSLRKACIKWSFVIVPAAALAVTPHAVFYDPTLLLLPLWIVVESIPQARILRRISTVLAGPWVFMAFVFPAPWSAISSIGVLTFLIAALWTLRQNTTGQ